MGIVVDHNLWVWRRLFVRYVLCVENVVSGVVGGVLIVMIVVGEHITVK